MRKRIWRISEDQFDIHKPKIEFSDERIEDVFTIGDNYEGVFSFRSVNDVNLRGIIYSSNPYVQVKNPQFDGMEVHVHFSLKNLFFHEDDSIDGAFTIIANQLEEEVPFHFSFKKASCKTSVGVCTSLSDFCELAKDRWNEAMQLFYSKNMQTVAMNNQEKLLYQGYRNGVISSRNLESFLVSAGLKEELTFDLRETTVTFEDLQENQKEVIEITKNTWGYIEIDIASNADFVTVEKEKINSDFFLGSRFSFNIYIHKNHLHAGRNEATVTFDGNGIHKEVHVVASLKTLDDKSYEMKWKIDKCKADFASNYRDFRFRKITTGDWCKESIRLLDELENLEQMSMTKEELLSHKRNPMYQLMRSQALLANRQKQDALWIISDLKKDIQDKKSTEWAYLLYLCTLIEPEESYVNKLTEEIEKIFREKEENDPRIFWFLLFLREKYITDFGRKLKDIAAWVENGITSPYIFIEAYYIFTQEPYQLTRFDGFTKKILAWACRHGIINRNITLQIAHILEKEREFDEVVYRIAEYAYKEFPEQDLLYQMLSYLLKNECYGERYLHWYEMALERQIRLTGLYEAYIQSLPESYAGPLPELITMYFKYDSHLPYQRKALVYANVIGHKKAAPNVYQQYLKNIESFAMEQMRCGRIDDNLAVIYQNLLDIGLINSDVADAMGRLAFSNKVVCSVPGVIRVILYEEYSNKPMVFPVDQGISYVPVLTEQYQLFLETEDGAIISDDRAYFMTPLICHLGFYQELMDQAKIKLPYIIHNISTYGRESMFDRDDILHIETFLNSDDIAPEYVASMYPKFISFLKEHNREDIIEKHLLLTEPYEYLDANLTNYLLEITIQNGFYEKAYEKMKKYNGSHVEARLLLKMVSVILDETTMEARDDLITIAAGLLSRGEYAISTVTYLEKFFVGPTRLMQKICNLAEEYQIKAEALLERTMIQMLYTESMDLSSGGLYRQYSYHNPNRMVIEAYLTFFSHEYMYDRDTPQEVFDDLLRFYYQDMKLNDSCKFALMKYLCTRVQLDDKEYASLDHLVKEATLRNIYFGFFKKMDRRLMVKYHLYDKTFIEYHGRPRSRVIISYKRNHYSPVSEDMVEMYDGIFVKQVVMFFGDTIDYEIMGDDVDNLPVAKDSITFHEACNDEEDSRYALLNRMESYYIYGDKERLKHDMMNYHGLDIVTRELFTII